MSTQPAHRTLFKGGAVVTMDRNIPNLGTGDVLVEGEHIVAVGADIQADDAEVIDAGAAIVMPGLIDAHHHMWLGVMRRMMPDVDHLFAYIDVVAETLGAHYRPLDMYLSTRLTALASLDAGITTIIDACHSSRSPDHTDAALDALDNAGIRALHMVGAAMDKRASAAHLPGDLKRLADNWNNDGGLVQVGLFGQLNLDWWKVGRSLDMRILTEFIGDLARLGPEFAEKGVLGSHNIFNHCTRVPQETWKLFADAGVNITVNPRSDALFGFDDEGFAYQQAIDHGLTPALGIDLDTAFGSDLFGEMHALRSGTTTGTRATPCSATACCSRPCPATLTPQLAAALATTGTATVFTVLTRRHFGERGWVGAMLFGAATAADLYSGRLAFAFGALPALGAILALDSELPALAVRWRSCRRCAARSRRCSPRSWRPATRSGA